MQDFLALYEKGYRWIEPDQYDDLRTGIVMRNRLGAQILTINGLKRAGAAWGDQMLDSEDIEKMFNFIGFISTIDLNNVNKKTIGDAGGW
jgi:hypothetical protein